MIPRSKIAIDHSIDEQYETKCVLCRVQSLLYSRVGGGGGVKVVVSVISGDGCIDWWCIIYVVHEQCICIMYICMWYQISFNILRLTCLI